MKPYVPAGVALAFVVLSFAPARAPLAGAVPAGAVPAGSPADEARSLLAQGQGAEALEKVEVALEEAPDSFELLDLASRAAQAAGRNDHALWYGGLALDQGPAPEAKDGVKALEELRARLAALDPLQGRAGGALADYQGALLSAGTALARKKLVVSAVSLLDRVERPGLREKAVAELEKIYADKKGVAALLDSGIDVPVKPKKKRKPEQIAKEDKKHETWDKAWEIKGDLYTIRTNMGLERAEAYSSAMEQINRFYRKFFRVKESGGSTARVTINVYRSRAEFDLHEKGPDGKSPDPGVKGFFSPSELRVVTYDTRDDGLPASFLWSTLFHEASHQFTHIALPSGAEPTWLNEGTASYFEGARMLPNGTVEVNLVAELRLDALKRSLEEGKPQLDDVITYVKPGSYPGEYYPFGWGLVYFFHNYRDDKSKLCYLEPYRNFMAAYKSGAKHDVKGRFVEHFVTKAKQPGIATFEDFEQRWKGWIVELHGLWFGEPEVAGTLIERARKQKLDGQIEASEETYVWALRKRPDDPVALVELAEVLELAKKPDAALARNRRALEVLRGVDDPDAKPAGSDDLSAKDLIDVCTQRIARLDKPTAEALTAADGKLLAAAPETATAYAEAGLPLVALAFLDDAEEAFGLPDAFAEHAQEIVKSSGADPRRTRRVRIDPDLTAWSGDEEWIAQDGALLCQTENAAFTSVQLDLPDRWRYEATVDGSALEPDGFVFLVFGDNEQSLQMFGFNGQGQGLVAKLDEGFKPRKTTPSVKPDQRASVKLAIEVDGDAAEFFLNDKSVAKLVYKPGELDGQVGLVAQSGTVKARDVKLRY